MNNSKIWGLNEVLWIRGGIKLNKTLILIAIILIALSGFSIKTNNFEFEWLGVLETIIRIFK